MQHEGLSGTGICPQRLLPVLSASLLLAASCKDPQLSHQTPGSAPVMTTGLGGTLNQGTISTHLGIEGLGEDSRSAHKLSTKRFQRWLPSPSLLKRPPAVRGNQGAWKNEQLPGRKGWPTGLASVQGCHSVPLPTAPTLGPASLTFSSDSRALWLWVSAARSTSGAGHSPAACAPPAWAPGSSPGSRRCTRLSGGFTAQPLQDRRRPSTIHHPHLLRATAATGWAALTAPALVGVGAAQLACREQSGGSLLCRLEPWSGIPRKPAGSLHPQASPAQPRSLSPPSL